MRHGGACECNIMVHARVQCYKMPHPKVWHTIVQQQWRHSIIMSPKFEDRTCARRTHPSNHYVPAGSAITSGPGASSPRRPSPGASSPGGLAEKEEGLSLLEAERAHKRHQCVWVAVLRHTHDRRTRPAFRTTRLCMSVRGWAWGVLAWVGDELLHKRPTWWQAHAIEWCVGCPRSLSPSGGSPHIHDCGLS